MHTITITEEPDALTGMTPVGKSVILTVESGDHLIIKRKTGSDPETRKAALRAIIDRMKNRRYNPNVETASEALKAMRDGRG